MGHRLFSAGDASDPQFRNLRDIDNEWTIPARAFAESLWDRFRVYADQHFLIGIRRDFHARFWEMYLTCALLEYANQHHAVLSCPKPGPDILIECGGRRVWVEAVVVTNGVPGRPDSVADPGLSYSGKIPEEKLVLRYANAISEKYRKYREYLRKNKIKKNDAFVIAVNGGGLSYKWTQAADDVPRFLKAVYPLGFYQLLLDRRTGAIVGQQNEPRFNIAKASGARVGTMGFLERRSRGISAILGSSVDAMCHRPALGFDFELAHNPMSRSPIGDRVIPAQKAWRAVLNETGAELTGHSLV